MFTFSHKTAKQTFFGAQKQPAKETTGRLPKTNMFLLIPLKTVVYLWFVLVNFKYKNCLAKKIKYYI